MQEVRDAGRQRYRKSEIQEYTEVESGARSQDAGRLRGAGRHRCRQTEMQEIRDAGRQDPGEVHAA
eukprot:1144290-Pelagomonas_calceolata.AAC.2